MLHVQAAAHQVVSRKALDQAHLTHRQHAIVEYKQRLREANARTREFDAVTAERDVQRQAYEGLRKQRLDEFMAGFRVIGMKLKEMYQVRGEETSRRSDSSSQHSTN